MKPVLHFRPATIEDAELLARHIYEVSAGVVPVLLDGLFMGLSAQTILTTVLQDTHSHYSFRNCVLAEYQGTVAGLLFAYAGTQQGIPKIMEQFLPAKRVNAVRELLCATVPDSLYINTLWVASNMQSKGLGSALLDYAGFQALNSGFTALSLFAWADNTRAVNFYTRHGFVPTRPITATEGLQLMHPHGGHLYTKIL